MCAHCAFPEMATPRGGVGRRVQTKKPSMGGVWMEAMHFKCVQISPITSLTDLSSCLVELVHSCFLEHGLTLLSALLPFNTAPALQCIFLKSL